VPSPPPVTECSLEELEIVLRELGQPPYRARQVFSWVHRKGVAGYAEMTDLPRPLRDALAARSPVRGSRLVESHLSRDSTRKLLIELADGERVECVVIPEPPRLTVCVSTQVGCAVGCVFCASGAGGVVRNLTAGEIVEQILWLGERPTHVVVMGMGEPLHNVANLLRALDLIQSPSGLDLGARRITVSTSAPRRGFEAFLASGPRIQLAISVHTATDELRRKLVPGGGTASIAELSEMARRWFVKTGRDVTFEYVLIDSVNDRPADAAGLAELCGRHRNLNLIPMNPVPFAPNLRAPPRERVAAFVAILKAAGVVVHLRRRRGDDVAAACGQLRLSRAAGPTP